MKCVKGFLIKSRQEYIYIRISNDICETFFLFKNTKKRTFILSLFKPAQKLYDTIRHMIT